MTDQDPITDEMNESVCEYLREEFPNCEMKEPEIRGDLEPAGYVSDIFFRHLWTKYSVRVEEMFFAKPEHREKKDVIASLKNYNLADKLKEHKHILVTSMGLKKME